MASKNEGLPNSDGVVSTNENKGSDVAYIHANTLNEKSGKIERRAVTSVEQLRMIVRRLEQENLERSLKNSRIMARYNAEQPYAQTELTNRGLGWKSNFSTRPLASIIDRLAPRYVRAVQGLKYVTNSCLMRDEAPDATKKTEVYRRELTSLLRSHRKWKGLLTQMAQENALFGWTIVSIPDDVSWMPRAPRQDEVFVPAGTGQHADEAQLVVMREDILPSELFSRIEDQEIAEVAGWKIEETVKAINAARPTSVTDNHQHSYRSYQDLIREGGLSLSFGGGVTNVKTYHCFITEPNGRVSHYILAGDMLELIFVRQDRFRRMSDTAVFYTFQQGNGRLHGSLGVGRLAYNIASVVDRARCEVVDRLQLSGKILVSTDQKDLNRFKLVVMGSAAIIGDQYKVQQQKLEAGVEDFLKLDQFLNGVLNETAGNVTPNSPNIQGERVTAAAVNLVAGREEELRDIRLERFIDCFSNMVSLIQRRLSDEDVRKSDPDAKAFYDRCMKHMTDEEFNIISHRPASETVEDFTEDERQRRILQLKEWANDPFVDQAKVRKMLAQLTLGEETASEILLDMNDPNLQAKEQRQQLMEVQTLQQGIDVPVVSTDLHAVHADILMKALQGLDPNAQENRPAFDHLMAHAMASGDKNLVTGVRQFVAENMRLAKQNAATQQGGQNLGVDAAGAQSQPTGDAIQPTPAASPV